MTREEIVASLKDPSCDRIAIAKAIQEMKAATEQLSENEKELAWALMHEIEDTSYTWDDIIRAMTRLLLEFDLEHKNADS